MNFSFVAVVAFQNLAAVAFLPRLACYASITISKIRLQSIWLVLFDTCAVRLDAPFGSVRKTPLFPVLVVPVSNLVSCTFQTKIEPSRHFLAPIALIVQLHLSKGRAGGAFCSSLLSESILIICSFFSKEMKSIFSLIFSGALYNKL